MLSATGTMAAINPIRYRGYYFDSDSGLYYLKSRYYDPNLQRFINSDEAVSTGQGFIGTNTFAYCLNNPLIYVDVDGNNPISIAIALVTIGEGFSLALGGTTAYYSNVTATFNFPKLSVSIEREYYSKRTIITRPEQSYGRVPFAGLCRLFISVYVPGAGLPGARASAFPAPHGSEICPDRAAYSAPAIDTHKAQCRWPWPFPPANTQWHWIPLP